MYRIALLYEHTSREMISLTRLKEILQSKYGFEVYLFSIQFQVYELLQCNRKHEFDAIVLPYVYKEGSLNPIGRILKKNKHTIIYNLHHEQLSPPFDEPRMLPCDSISKNMVVHFVWNERFKNKLISTGTDDDVIFITGNIRSDDLSVSAKKISREKLAIEFHLDPQKKWILICESWGQLLSDELMDARVLTGVKKKDMDEFNNLTAKALKEFSRQSFELDNTIFDHYEIIYRNHPGAKDNIELNRKIHKISEYSVYDWFHCVVANKARHSTTLFEAEKAGIHAIRYDPTGMDLYYVQEGINKYQTINHLNEIIGIETNESRKHNVFEEYLGCCDGKCTERVALGIANSIGCERYTFNPTVFKYNKKRYLRKCFSNILGKMIIKISPHLGERIMPSLRLYKNDIPEEWKRRGTKEYE